MFGFELDLGGVKLSFKGNCCIAAMRRVHGSCGNCKISVGGLCNPMFPQVFCRFRCAMISSVTKSRNAAMRLAFRNSSG